jgi:hypothetical protein
LTIHIADSYEASFAENQHQQRRKYTFLACKKPFSLRMDFDLTDKRRPFANSISAPARTRGIGTSIEVGVGWCALEDGKVAQMRFVADEADAKGIDRRYCEFPDRPGSRPGISSPKEE